MKFRRFFSVLAAGALAAPLAQAALITNLDGSFDFGAFDWHAAGTAFTQGFDPGTPGDTFTLTYFGFANSVSDSQGSTLALPGLDNNANDTGFATGRRYEYTAVAVLNERVDQCTPVVGGTSCSFTLLSGSYAIYYDTNSATAARLALGQGFADGTRILEGQFLPGQPGGDFTNFGAGNGSGNAGLVGSADMLVTLPTQFLLGSFDGTVIGTTLQAGDRRTSAPATGLGGVPFATFPNRIASDVVLQADANQSFFVVPEPGTLSLLAGAMLGVGALTGRRRLGGRRSG